ncbi:hypothetical protein [Baia soyae]|uniref:Uncharacterized protein n=1 Tax=Baia soyae TaxID=1544746 RepID=A0A4R2RCX3_9BACL|nr:hypothetical protein [Baia soyae]TCP61280.1 hypothetical protein EDD57_1632 [Baia soyae]
MLKIRLEGPNEQVESFIYEMDRNPSVELHETEENCEVESGRVITYSQCALSCSPRNRVEILELETIDGVTITIPLLDVVQVRISDEETITCGKSYDIFADNKKGHATWPK